MTTTSSRGFWRCLSATLGGPSLTWAAVVAAAGLVTWWVTAFRTDHQMDSYQWAGFAVGVVALVATLTFAAAEAPREPTVEARRLRKSLSASLLILLALPATLALSSLLWPTNFAWFLAAALTAALLVTAATVASKRMFRFVALVTVVLAVTGLSVLGARQAGEDDDMRIDQLVTHGVDRALQTTTGSLFNDDVEPTMGVAGYALLTPLLIVGYRQLELRNNHQYGRPVEVAPMLGVPKDATEALTHRLRARILDVGMEGPGPIPGSKSADELSRLLTEAEDSLSCSFVFDVADGEPGGVSRRLGRWGSGRGS